MIRLPVPSLLVGPAGKWFKCGAQFSQGFGTADELRVSPGTPTAAGTGKGPTCQGSSRTRRGQTRPRSDLDAPFEGRGGRPWDGGRGMRTERKQLTDRRGVEKAAGSPKFIQSPPDAEVRAGADIALIDFAIVSNVANDARGPILGEAELLAIGALGADKPHDVRFRGFERLIDVLRRDPELFGVDHGVERPFHDQEPVVILLPHDGCERFLRNDVR